MIALQLMDPAKVPKCMKSGPRYLAPPHMKGRAKKEALKRHQTKTNEQEKKSKVRECLKAFSRGSSFIESLWMQLFSLIFVCHARAVRLTGEVADCIKLFITSSHRIAHILSSFE